MMPLKNDRAELRKRMQGSPGAVAGAVEGAAGAGQGGYLRLLLRWLLCLELARTGADLRAAVSFRHAGHAEPGGCQASKGCAGAARCIRPTGAERTVAGLRGRDECRQVDWQLLSYGGAVHSFTDPNANVPGKMQYDRRTSGRAFRAMHNC
jgi:dienelactone hydrolase